MTRRLRHPVAATLLAAGCLAAVGCGGRVDAPPPDTLILAVQGDANSLDPHAVTDAPSMRMIENLYSTLLRYGEDYEAMTLRPDLAERHEISDDKLTYTFHLDPDATFHSGRPVTAEDVRFSLQRIRDEGVRSRHLATIDRIETPDDRTVVLHLAEPTAPLLTYLAYPMNAIVDREAIDANGGDLRSTDAGSGPYRLVRWQRGRRLELARHDGYHLPDLPRTATLIYRPVADETARTTSIRLGEVHILHEVPAKDRDALQRARGVRVESVPGTFWEYIGLNTQRPPLDDVRVRRAIAWAVDREQLNRAIKFGHATVLDGGHIPPNHWAYADLHVYPEVDRDKARALLEEAGHPDGFTMRMAVDSSIDYQVRAAEMVKQQLAAVGIRVELKGLEPGVFYQQLNDRDFDSTLVGWLGFVDPDEWVAEIYHSDGAYNQQAYRNERVDELIERGARVHDRDERRAIYRELQRLIAEDAPTVFLYVNPHTTAMREAVEGYVVHPTGTTLWAASASVPSPAPVAAAEAP